VTGAGGRSRGRGRGLTAAGVPAAGGRKPARMKGKAFLKDSRAPGGDVQPPWGKNWNGVMAQTGGRRGRTIRSDWLGIDQRLFPERSKGEKT